MKKNLPLIVFSLLLFFSISLLAQQKSIKTPAHLWEAIPKNLVKQDLPTVNQAPIEENLPLFSRVDQETLIGTTIYDLQTNASTMPRLFNFGDGRLSAVWTMGFDSGNGYPDRGTGYNHFDGTSWLDQPTTRLEANTRTGWPCITATADDEEVIVNHVFQDPFNLYSLKSDAGMNTWTENSVPNNVPPGVVWPRIGVGGPDGNTIHAIAITRPEGNGGQIYEGVNGHILYYRSLDGGNTWDIQDMVLPGLDNTVMSAGSADDYAIDVRGETVVIASFGVFTDVAILKSTDNGVNWTRSVAKQFPIPNYEIDQGYTVDDLPPFQEGQPDTLAIQTSDGSGAVIIDNNDMVHVFYGNMYVLDQDLTDGGWTFFPATSGMTYWNESFGIDSTRIIADVIDANSNGILDIASIDEIASYGLSLTAHPSVGIDEDNQLYLVYSAVMEEYIATGATPNQQHVRHIFAISSKDGGENWTAPYNLINEDISAEPDLISNSEAVFPSVARHVDDKLHLIYQLDFEPGLSIQGDEDGATTNFISYICLETTIFDEVDTKEVINELIDFQAFPNPVSETVRISFNQKIAESFYLGVYDLNGKELYRQSFDNAPVGTFTHEINMNDFPSGTYFTKLVLSEGIGIQKIVKN